MPSTQPQFSPEQIAAVKNYRKIEELMPSHWLESFVKANGLRHHYYRTRGEKPQLVLLHGFEESAICWLRVAKVLEQDYDIILIDARGHGLSDRITTGFTPQLLTEDVAEVIQALKLAQPHILGFSMGSDTAIRLAATHPGLMRTIIVSGASDQAPQPQHFVNSPGYQAWYQSFVDYLKALKTQTHEERMVSSLRTLLPGTPLPPEDQYVPLVEASAQIDMDLVLLGNELWSQARQQYEEARQLQMRITCPILLMYSEHFSTPDAPVTLREEPGERSNEKIVCFENAGHLIYREHFEQFIEVVTTFLKEH